jgi:hypothetical protein
LSIHRQNNVTFFTPFFSAILHERGVSEIPVYETNPLFTHSENDGRKKERVSWGVLVITVSGFVQTKNNHENMILARRKFIVTHARRTIERYIHFFVIKAPFLKASSPVGSSPYIRTKPPIGRRFHVKSVPCLSVKIFFTRGGIPNQNSSTFIPESRAVIKCPNSWMRTMRRKTKIARRIPRKIYMSFY